MKSAIKHLWSSLRDLATQSPILLVLIAVFSCTPLYIEQDWFSDIDLGLYTLYFFIVILETYIMRDRKFSIIYTLLSALVYIRFTKRTITYEASSWPQKTYHTYGYTL